MAPKPKPEPKPKPDPKPDRLEAASKKAGWRDRVGTRIGTWVLGFVLSNLLTAIIAFAFGVFGGAYLEVFFTNRGARFGYMDASLDFMHERLFRGYYGDYHDDTGKTELIDALFTLREGSQTGKFTGTKTREYDNHKYTLTGFTNGVHIVLTQRGQSQAHGEAILLLKIGEDSADKHQVFYGYEITEDVDPTLASPHITLKQCPLLLLDEDTFQRIYKTMDSVKNRYPFLDAGCVDFAVPGPFAKPKQP